MLLKKEEMLLVKIFKGYSLLVNRHNNGEEGSEDWCGIPTGAKNYMYFVIKISGSGI